MTTNETIWESRPTALITGGSRGIGFELAKQFAQHGHDLILASRNQSELQRAADKLHKDFDCTVTAVSLDLTASDAPETLFSQLQAQAIQVDVLVNNAGLGDYGLFVDSQLDRQLDLLRLNILSLTTLTHLFLKGMIERGNGRVLNVASVVAYFSGGPRWTSYLASKHYVLAFTRGLAKELAGTGVSATVLCPGPTATEFISDAGVGATRVYRWLPKLSPSGVARAGYHATMAGRTTVIPGLINKVLAFLGELPPRVIAQSVFGFLSRGSA
ncbi:MAG: SDR family oxidoreductase [Pseudomonadota bacterium]